MGIRQAEGLLWFSLRLSVMLFPATYDDTNVMQMWMGRLFHFV